MSDLLLDALPTRWHGHEIIPDFRPMVWLVNAYVRGQTDADPTGFAVSALWRFYRDPRCFLHDPQKIIDAYGHMIEFYRAVEKAAESAESAFLVSLTVTTQIFLSDLCHTHNSLHHP